MVWVKTDSTGRIDLGVGVEDVDQAVAHLRAHHLTGEGCRLEDELHRQPQQHSDQSFGEHHAQHPPRRQRQPARPADRIQQRRQQHHQADLDARCNRVASQKRRKDQQAGTRAPTQATAVIISSNCGSAGICLLLSG